jgi:hypothetical protein
MNKISQKILLIILIILQKNNNTMNFLKINKNETRNYHGVPIFFSPNRSNQYFLENAGYQLLKLFLYHLKKNNNPFL